MRLLATGLALALLVPAVPAYAVQAPQQVKDPAA